MGKTILTLHTLTSIHTGGVDLNCHRLHETGILGSLRWWYEALVRASGGKVCELPDHPCALDEKLLDRHKPPDRESLIQAGLCDVCQVFGATGWRKRFSLDIHELTMKADPNIIPGQAGTMHIEIPGSERGWYLRPGRVGRFALHLGGAEAGLITDLVHFIAARGGLGARTQLGSGVVQVDEITPAEPLPTGALAAKLRALPGDNLATYDLFPSFKRMFFARLGLEPREDRLETPFEIKHALRSVFRKQGDEKMRHDLFGLVQRSTRLGSMLSMSFPYQSADGLELRLWGWIPQPYWPSAADRIYSYIDENYSLLEWEQYDPAQILDPIDFLEKIWR